MVSVVPFYIDSKKKNLIAPENTVNCGRKQKFDGVTRRRLRELQVVRAEGQACKRTVEFLCREMVEKKTALDAAVNEYERKKAELVERQANAHDKLAVMLESRSAAELCREKAEYRVEKELKAQQTACTVRAYRLDARWRQLYNHYRGFVVNVLGDDGDLLSSTDATGLAKQMRPSDVDRPSPAKCGRRFFAIADKFGAQYRRESLRTSRSLRTLMAGYLRETSAGNVHGGDSVRGPSSSRSRSSTTRILDRAEPERVLEKLRVMQEQCARIAERVRMRTGYPIAAAVTPRAVDKNHGDNGRSQSELLSVARHRLAVGREYLQNVRELTGRAVADVRSDRTELREILCRTCAVCTGRKLRPDDNASHTVVDIAAQLERACFDLFARLDRTRSTDDDDPDRSGGARRLDTVTLCLRAVQERRANAVRQACEVAYRVKDFHKAVTRLLVATSIAPVTTKRNATTLRRPRGKDDSRTRPRDRYHCENKLRSTSIMNNAAITISSKSRLPNEQFGGITSPITRVATTAAELALNNDAAHANTMTTTMVNMLYPPSMDII